MSSKIKFGIIGCGHIGSRHAEVIRQNPNLELLAVCDSNLQVLDSFKHLKISKHEHLDEMLESVPDIDVLTIATPNGLHAEHALKGLNVGKHIVLEKPMALKSLDCMSIIKKAEAIKKEVFCVMQNRYSPPSKWLKEIIDKDLLGEIYLVQVNCFWNRDNRYYSGKNWRGLLDQDGGTLFTQFSHFVDLLYWVFGDIENISGKFNDFNHQELTAFEDSGQVWFNFKRGGQGQLNYSSSVWNKNLESSITIIAEKGSVKIGGQYMNKVEHCHIKDYLQPDLMESEPANNYGPYQGSAANHKFVYENIYNVLNSREHITTNAEDGKKVVEIIERIYQNNSYLNKSLS